MALHALANDGRSINQCLGFAAAGSLCEIEGHHAHFTSVLCYPVFAEGANYSDGPDDRYLDPWHIMQMVDAFSRALALGPVADRSTTLSPSLLRAAGRSRRSLLSRRS